MINTVFLDMDEVLVSFNKGVYKAFNLPYCYETFFREYKYFSKIGQTTKSVAAKCTFEFWTNLEWMHDGRDLLRAITNKFEAENIYLLTTYMPNADSPSGKVLWLQNQLPEYLSRVILLPFGVPKSFLARPDTLLIDDKDENVDGFREAGGKALLVPRPWNRAHVSADRTVQVVKEFLGRIE